MRVHRERARAYLWLSFQRFNLLLDFIDRAQFILLIVPPVEQLREYPTAFPNTKSM